MTKHSRRYGVGSAIFFVLAFGRASSRDIASAHTSFCIKFSLGRGYNRLNMAGVLGFRKFNIIPFLILICLFFTSCASYNYKYKSDDRKINIQSDNLKEFEVVTVGSNIKLSKTFSGYSPTELKDLKKENLSLVLVHPNYEPISIEVKRTPRPKALVKDVGLSIFTFGIPIIIDVFNDDFYRVSPKTKNFNVHFEYKQSFMSDELAKIRNTKNPEDYNAWIANYPKSNMMQVAIDAKDSLELDIALNKESESAIDEFITSHQTSTYLSQALKIKEEMVAARKMFEQTKIDNTVIAFENFLAKYPRSLHNTEAHRRLIDAAEKSALASMNSTKMISYIKDYLIPNNRFLNQNEVDQKKTAVTKALDAFLVKENIKSDPKKVYDYYSNLWKAYNTVINQVPAEYLTSFDLVLSYKPKIADLLFNKIKEASTAEKQSALVVKINADFPQLERWDQSKNVLITVLEESSKGSGMIKLFNVGFLPYYFDNMSERDALKGRDFYSYRGSDYKSLKGITYEELNFLNGQLNGVSKAYLGNVLDFAMNIGTSGPKEISYYQNSKLVYVTTFLPNYKEYSYEFDNGVNLTLKKVDENLISISNYIVEMKKSLSQNDFDIFLENSKKAVAIIGETENYCKNLNIPSDKCQVKIDKKGDELSLVIDQAEKKIAALNAQREKEQQELYNQFVKAVINQANGYAEKGYSSGTTSNYNSRNNSSSQSNSNVRGKTNVYVCDDCGKVQVSETAPYDKSTCPETRWGGIGGAGNLWDDGDHNYSNMGSSGTNQYYCSRCNIAIMLYESPRNPGACGASGSNCCSHYWKKN